jgi:GNAT superfamily N-acetyltransferase
MDIKLILRNGCTKEQAIEMFEKAMESEEVQNALAGQTIVSVVAVRNKLINIVTEKTMNLRTIPLNSVPVDKVRHLTLQDDGGMSDILRRIELFGHRRTCDNESIAILAGECDEIIGWLSFQPVTSGGKNHDKNFINLNVFVGNEHRRTGVGRRLIEEAKAMADSDWPGYAIYVYPHDELSRQFFSKYPFLVPIY